MARLVPGAVAVAFLASQGLAVRMAREEPMAQNVTQEELDRKSVCSFRTDPEVWHKYGPCAIERPEHLLVQRHVDPDSTGVLELGGRYGTTTCELARKLRNSGKVVAVEPDSSVWPFWQGNMESHHCRANLVKGVVGNKDHGGVKQDTYGTRAYRDLGNTDLGGAKWGTYLNVSATPWQEVELQFGVKIDTLLIDCEGCVLSFLDENPGLLEQVNTILLEGDMGEYKGYHSPAVCQPDCVQYDGLIASLESSGFRVVESWKEGDAIPEWELSSMLNNIWHFALKRA